MTDLVAFIRARLNEDEQLAVTAAGPHRYRPRWEADLWFDGTGERMDLHAGPGGYLTNQGALERPIAEHAARHDPARVLREIEGKKRIIDRIVLAANSTLSPHDDALIVCEDILRGLALAWAEHPDYRPDWRPRL